MKPKSLVILVGALTLLCTIGAMLLSELGLVAFFAGSFGGTLSFALLISFSEEVEQSVKKENQIINDYSEPILAQQFTEERIALPESEPPRQIRKRIMG